MKSNNFDFLIFSLPLFVVVANSYPFLGGNVSSQWIYKLTDGRIELSSIGLNVFFTISGYLIFLSLKRSSSFFDYYLKRVLRGFQALLIVLFTTAFLGPFVYESTIPYYKNVNVYSCFFRNLTLYRLQYGIEGVFENNVYLSAVNGSLRTICYEFLLYIFLSFLIFLRNNKYIIKVLISLAFILMYFSYNFLLEKFSMRMFFGLNGLHFLDLGTYFVGGSLFAIFEIDKRRTSNLLWVMLFILITALYLDIYTYFKNLFFLITILIFGLKSLKYISSFTKKGYPSYGIYIYSFPIEQTLMYYFNLTTFFLIIWSIFLSVLLVYIS